jgi:hypothetical protein
MAPQLAGRAAANASCAPGQRASTAALSATLRRRAVSLGVLNRLTTAP